MFYFVDVRLVFRTEIVLQARDKNLNRLFKVQSLEPVVQGKKIRGTLIHTKKKIIAGRIRLITELIGNSLVKKLLEHIVQGFISCLKH